MQGIPPPDERERELSRVQHYLSDQAFHHPKGESIGNKSRQQSRLDEDRKIIDNVTQMLPVESRRIDAVPGVRPIVSKSTQLSAIGTQFSTNTDDNRVAEMALDDTKL